MLRMMQTTRLISEAVTEMMRRALALAVLFLTPYRAVTVASRYTITANNAPRTITV